MKKLLLIAYFYPPLGGPGVQRPVKLVKYLKKFGWQTDVITVKDIVFHSYDKGLEQEDEANLVLRTPSLDPMSVLKLFTKNKTNRSNNIYFGSSERFKSFVRNLFPFDEKIGWFSSAYKAGKKLLKSTKYDAVMATTGPYTSALIAYKLSKKFNLPLIIDYRDHWSLNPYLKERTWVNKILSKYWESKILKHASVVSTIGNTMRSELIDQFGKQLKSKMKVMYNGFDESDFTGVKKQSNDKITFRYLGNFYGMRTPKYFIQALENLEKRKELPTDIQFEFIGNYYPESRKFLSQNSASKIIRIRDQVEHEEALQLLVNSDAVMLFIASATGKGILTGKIFEYLRSNKPILAMIPPDGEAAGILSETNQNNICSSEDVTSIEKNFLEIYKNLKNAKTDNSEQISEYSREKQTKGLVEFLEAKI
jgi:glycosyltransferase involved in cell wall biosynthesis